MFFISAFMVILLTIQDTDLLVTGYMVTTGPPGVIHRYNMLLGSTAQADGESKSFPVLSAAAQTWGRLGTITEDKDPSQTLFNSCCILRVMYPQHAERVCGYLSKKKELCPHAYLRPKSIGLVQAGYGEMRKQQNPIFTVVKFCLDVILTLFSLLNSFTEKFCSRCCSGNILRLPSQE